MQRVTRERPEIGRIACPWLVAWFVVKAPEFLFAPSRDVLLVSADSSVSRFHLRLPA